MIVQSLEHLSMIGILLESSRADHLINTLIEASNHGGLRLEYVFKWKMEDFLVIFK